MTETPNIPQTPLPQEDSDSASHAMLLRFVKWGPAVLVVLIVVLSIFFLFSEARRDSEPTISETALEPEETAGIPKQKRCPRVAIPTTPPRKLLYQDSTNCFYFFYPETYKELASNLIRRDSDPEDVDISETLVLFRWNLITPEQFTTLYDAPDGAEVPELTFTPESKTYKGKNLELSNTRAVMYLVETYANEEETTFDSCSRFFVVETGNTITTIEDRIAKNPPTNCSSVRKTYPRNDLDAILDTFVVYRKK